MGNWHALPAPWLHLGARAWVQPRCSPGVGVGVGSPRGRSPRVWASGVRVRAEGRSCGQRCAGSGRSTSSLAGRRSRPHVPAPPSQEAVSCPPAGGADGCAQWYMVPAALWAPRPSRWPGRVWGTSRFQQKPKLRPPLSLLRAGERRGRRGRASGRAGRSGAGPGRAPPETFPPAPGRKAGGWAVQRAAPRLSSPTPRRLAGPSLGANLEVTVTL